MTFHLKPITLFYFLDWSLAESLSAGRSRHEGRSQVEGEHRRRPSHADHLWGPLRLHDQELFLRQMQIRRLIDKRKIRLVTMADETRKKFIIQPYMYYFRTKKINVIYTNRGGWDSPWIKLGLWLATSTWKTVGKAWWIPAQVWQMQNISKNQLYHPSLYFYTKQYVNLK